jgi:hypothetical protein
MPVEDICSAEAMQTIALLRDISQGFVEGAKNIGLLSISRFDAEGPGWPPLSEWQQEVRAAAGKSGQKMLQFDMSMYDSVNGLASATEPSGNLSGKGFNVKWTTSVASLSDQSFEVEMGGYKAIHQKGGVAGMGSVIPARPFWVSGAEVDKLISDSMTKWLNEGMSRIWKQ